MGRVEGKVALVTGAASGMGRADARLLAAEGASVVVADMNEADGGAVADAIGARAVFMRLNVTDEDNWKAVIAATVEKFGRLDILFNNAGAPTARTTIEHCPTDSWRRAFDINIHSAFHVTRAAIPHLRRYGKGSIINNLSLSVQTGGSGGAGPYAAAKGALQVFTRTLSRELAPDVRANCIMPGVVETRHHERFTSPEKMADYRRQTPLGRNSKPEEVAGSVLFLASDASSFMTGALLDLNGGRFLR